MNRTLHSMTALVVTMILAPTTSAPAATIGVIGNVSWQPTPGGGAATRVNGGSSLVANNTLNPIVRIDVAVRVSEGDNQGLSQVVYDIVSPEAKAKGYFFSSMQRADSGFNNMGGPPALHDISAPMYDLAQPCPPPANYGGGWGFTQSGLPHGGNNSVNPGTILGAGDSLPITWSGDQSPILPGIQSFARIGVGQGLYTAAPEDPFLGGTTLGFGSDVANGIGGGDGSWWFHSLYLDTTAWDRQAYTFVITTTAGNVLRSEADLSQPLGGGFREAVLGDDLIGTMLRLTLVPEPAVTFVLLGALTLIRRR